ncbi:MAG: VWA domain-containing protein, partial [Anaerohalosphaera sp.]|nr:VWA domain-containing protein [Anaerohalosphaera sp.]
KPESGRLAVVDIAELASISKLSSKDTEIRRRNTAITGQQSKLSEGIQMALAIAPPNTAARILLVSDGNETEGDLKQAAEIAAMNNIPIDVLPVEYAYANEVIFKRLNAPVRARSNQTVSLRFVLNSTGYNQGRIYLNLNDTPVDLVPGSSQVAADVRLKPGTNVHTISLPVGTRGVHEFEAIFVPDDPAADQIDANNRSSAITYVAGPGNVLVIDGDGKSAVSLSEMLGQCEMEVEYMHAAEFPDNIARLMDTDAIILANTSCSNFSYQQQEMLVRYVTDIGGGLVMTGGPEAFGAGGWIGSPVQEVLPIDLDPPQKKQLPKGALVLIMHSCEMPQGNLWGERVAIAAVRTLSRLDLVGVLSYNWSGSGNSNWVYPLSEAGDKEGLISSIKQMSIGDMPDLGAHIQLAYDALKDADAAQKHIIVISDGDPAPPTKELLAKVKDAGITCTGIAVFPHSPNDVQSLLYLAKSTGGRFYDVKDPQQLPKIFIKEAQVIKRALILEQPFIPQITFSIDEILKGISAPLPPLDGFVLTGPKGGLSRIIISNNEGDPVVASCQAGLGRCSVFTSALDSRWGSNWLAWDNGRRFAEQLVRWAAKPGQASDCEILVDVQGNDVNVHIEALDSNGEYLRLSNMIAQVISPDINSNELILNQVGPGQYKGTFEANMPGSHLLNLRYRKRGAQQKDLLMQTPFTVPFAPEFSDLTDNVALLRQVSELSGGRMIETAPDEANLFDPSGVKFPQTFIPLTKELMFLWLGVFLFDVAVRRIAVDFKAGFNKLASMLKSKGKAHQAQQTLTRLKKTQKKMQKHLYRDDTEVVRKQRFEASKDAKDEMPLTDTSPKEDVKKPTEKEKPKKDKPQSTEQGHIQQLLNAKKKAIRDKDGQKE